MATASCTHTHPASSRRTGGPLWHIFARCSSVRRARLTPSRLLTAPNWSRSGERDDANKSDARSSDLGCFWPPWIARLRGWGHFEQQTVLHFLPFRLLILAWSRAGLSGSRNASPPDGRALGI